MSGAAYPAPITHNNVLNTVFNNSDFNYSSLTNTTVSGNLNVNGLGTFSNGIQSNGNFNCTGSSNVLSSNVTSNQSVGGNLIVGTGGSLTLPSTKIINSSNDVVDTNNTQSISGLKTLTSGLTLGASSSLTLPSTKIINSSNDVVDTNNTQSISGLKTFSSIATFSSGLQQPIPSSLSSSSTPTVNCNNYTYATFTLTLSANITGFTFSNARAGGQYMIFITGAASTFTISNTLTGTPAIKTNYATAITVPINGKALITAFYDGTNIFIDCSLYA